MDERPSQKKDIDGIDVQMSEFSEAFLAILGRNLVNLGARVICVQVGYDFSS